MAQPIGSRVLLNGSAVEVYQDDQGQYAIVGERRIYARFLPAEVLKKQITEWGSGILDEGEWALSRDLDAMLLELADSIPQRKSRLFAIHACRSIQVTPEGRSLEVLCAAEQHADGEIDDDALREVWSQLELKVHDTGLQGDTQFRKERLEAAVSLAADPVPLGGGNLFAIAGLVAITNSPTKSPTDVEARKQLLDVQFTDLLREMIGNPFRRVALSPQWLQWDHGAIPKMAQEIYNSGRWQDLQILADALEDAGCDNHDLLDHCRSGRDHVKGCWVLDLLLFGSH